LCDTIATRSPKPMPSASSPAAWAHPFAVDLLGAVEEVDHREGDKHGGLLA
jgi:hypothetical protein